MNCFYSSSSFECVYWEGKGTVRRFGGLCAIMDVQPDENNDSTKSEAQQSMMQGLEVDQWIDVY
jgi:hypothetical protein